MARKLTDAERLTLAQVRSDPGLMDKPDWRLDVMRRILAGVLERGDDPDITEADASAIAEYGRIVGGKDEPRDG
jgi:hypothetical protein